MATQALGRLYEHTAGKVILYLPVAVVRDSAFPFKVGEQVSVKLDAKLKRLVVEKRHD
jgi:hypothetical protein